MPIVVLSPMQTSRFFGNFVVLLLSTFAFISLITTSCANIGDITGGPQDTLPPRILREVPENFSLHFEAKQIELYFDEYLKPGGFAQQFIVSPPLKNKPEFKLAGRKLTLIINDTLIEETTYAMSFGNGLADLNEGNVLKGYKYVFSTGDYIDSLEIKGRVKGIEPISKYDDFIAMLYPIDSLIIDSIPLKELPLYYGKLEDNGSFTIDYLKEDFFRLIVIEDVNGNFKYDPGIDAIGFYADSIPAGVELDVPILIFTEAKPSSPQTPRMISPYEMAISFTAPFEFAEAELIYSNNNILAQRFSKGMDSLTVFLDQAIEDSLYLIIHQMERSDTLKARAPSRKTWPEWKLVSGTKQSLNPNDTFRIFSSQPIFDVDSTKMFLYSVEGEEQDTLHFRVTLDESLFFVNILFDRKEGVPYDFQLLPGALSSYRELEHDTLEQKFTSKKKEELGILILEIEMDTVLPVFFELTNAQGNLILKDSINQGTYKVKLENMEPAKYQLRAVHDRNRNMQWDTGNYLKALQPEEILRYPEEIQLRANWDLEIDWKIVF